MDGAGRLKQIIHVKLPSFAPVIVVLLILRLGLYNSESLEVATEQDGTLKLIDCILADDINGGSALFSGSVTLENTVQYNNGIGTNPNFVNPSQTWEGFNNKMNSQYYGTLKGWYWGN